MSERERGIGLVGCGVISEIYLKNLSGKPGFEGSRIVAIADLMPERAKERGAQFGIEKVLTVEDLLADPAVDIVLNLTPPDAHASLGLTALAAGKSVYTEKPLAIEREDGRRMVDEAAANNLLLGGAPDTFLGAGLQTCREVIDSGQIGTPVAATAFMLTHGPESWHPAPDFFYRRGAGPLFDMGPYYLTALITLLGPVARVSGAARASFPERVISSKPRAGERIPVETNTHVAGVLEFAAGPIATLVTSFDVWAHETRPLEIYGADGTLSLPDPNRFDGPVRVRAAQEREWREVELSRPYGQDSRGIGVADMARAMTEGRTPRASGDLIYHVLDVMHAIEEASREGHRIDLASSCERPEPMPATIAATA